jgi:hypothetical protein
MFAATCGVLLFSGAFTWAHYFGNDCLLVLDEGNLRFRFIAERRDPSLDWTEIYDPHPWPELREPEGPPAQGLAHNRAFHLTWKYPTFVKTDVSAVGVCWEARLPLWTLLALLGALPLGRSIKGFLARRQAADSPARPVWTTASCGLLLASLLTSGIVAALWLVGSVWCVGFTDGRYGIQLDRSALVLSTVYEREGVQTGWESGFAPARRFRWELPHLASCALSTFGQWHELVLPCWVLFGVSATPAVILLWRHRRRCLPGFCRKCGYNLTGNVSGRCPECGTEVGVPVNRTNNRAFAPGTRA